MYLYSKKYAPVLQKMYVFDLTCTPKDVCTIWPTTYLLVCTPKYIPIYEFIKY